MNCTKSHPQNPSNQRNQPKIDSCDRLCIEVTVTIPTSIEHLERLDVESLAQIIEIDNLEKVFIESFRAKSVSGAILGKVRLLIIYIF